MLKNPTQLSAREADRKKHEKILTELENIEKFSGCLGPAVSIFGSARITSNSEIFQLTQEIAFHLSRHGYTVISGGGPGIMRAANEGGRVGGTQTVGFNIALPFEPLDTSAQDIAVVFENFITRKLAFVKCSSAFIVMPGGMGTLDELFEVLTLIQTRRMEPVPVVLVGSRFWNGLVVWMREQLEGAGLINSVELREIQLFDDAETVAAFIKQKVPTKNARTARRI
jgi:uncharacterized protein (TIGR00730 family)